MCCIGSSKLSSSFCNQTLLFFLDIFSLALLYSSGWCLMPAGTAFGIEIQYPRILGSKYSSSYTLVKRWKCPTVQPFKTPILRLTKTTNERGNELTQEKQTQCTLLRHLASNSDRFHGSKHNTDKVHLVNMLNLVKSQWTIIIGKKLPSLSLMFCINDFGGF